jgi:predicted nucleic acid-binding Zn ribbon protein
VDPLGEEVRAELRRVGGPAAALATFAEAWPGAVGAEIARNAWPARLQGDGTLVVHARDAVWGFELTQRAPEIATRLPGSPRLKFVPGPLPDGEPEADSASSAPPLEATLEEAREAAAWAAGIEDDELRKAVARAARASLARAAADRSV